MRAVLYILFFFGQVFFLNAQELLPVKKYGKWGFIDYKGSLKIPCIYTKVGEFSNGYAVAVSDGKAGIVDTSGAVIVPCSYSNIQISPSSYFILKEEKTGLSDSLGNLLVPLEFLNVFQTNNKSFLLQGEHSYSLYHTDFNVISDYKWNRVEPIQGTLYIKVWKDGDIGVLNSKHEIIIPPQKNIDAVDTVSGCLAVKRSGLYTIYKEDGKVLSSEKRWKHYKRLDQNFIIVYDKPNELFLVSLPGASLLADNSYTGFRAITNNLIVTTKDLKEGLINNSGKIIADNVYEKIAFYNSDYLITKSTSGLGLINNNGKTILPPTCNFIDPFNESGFAVFARNNLMGVLHKNGAVIIPDKYADLEIDHLTIKGFYGRAMDVFSLSPEGKVVEKVSYQNVRRLTIGGRYTPRRVSYFSNTDMGVTEPISTNSSFNTANDRFNLIIQQHRYAPGTRIKTLIPNNIKDVEYLVGFGDKVNNRQIAATNFWDIQVAELENLEWARVIMPGSRQALISRKGQLKHSFKVRQGGKSVVKSITYIGPFNNGLARINLGGVFAKGVDIIDNRLTIRGHKLEVVGGVWGYVDGEGELSISPEYEYVSDFTNGKAIIKKNGKYGVIDTLNQHLIKPSYGYISWLPNSDHKYFLLEKKGRSYGAINSAGKVILKAIYQNVGEEGDGLIPIEMEDVWGYADTSGAVIIEPQFIEAYPFSEGVAAVKQGYRWGFIDKHGKWVIDPQFRHSGSFNSGLAPVYLKKWGYINKSGKLVIDDKYSRAEEFTGNFARVKNKGKWGLINVNGKTIIPPRYSKISYFDSYGLTIAKKGRKKKVINKSGKIIGSFKDVGHFNEGLAYARKKHKYGFIDTTGKPVIPFKYYGAGSFSEGLAQVRINGKWGYVNSKDSMIIIPQFQRCEEFSEGLGVGLIRGHTVIFDKSGFHLFMPEKAMGLGKYSYGYVLIGNVFYNKAGEVAWDKSMIKGTPFKKGLSIIKTREKEPGIGKYISKDVLIDENLIPLASYNHISQEINKYITFSTESSFGIATEDGTILLPCIYQNFSLINKNIFKVESFDEVGYFTSKGNWIWKLDR